MSRSYHVGAAAFAVEASEKWVDNLLSHHAIPGVVSGSRGVARRISGDGLLIVCLVRQLSTSIGLSLPAAVALAPQLVAGKGKVVSGPVQLSIDIERIERDLADRLFDATDVAMQKPRGRPPAARLR